MIEIHESIMDWEDTEKIHYINPTAIQRMEVLSSYAKVFVNNEDGKLTRIDTRTKSEIETIKNIW